MTQLWQKMLEELQRLHYSYPNPLDSLQLSPVDDASRRLQKK